MWSWDDDTASLKRNKNVEFVFAEEAVEKESFESNDSINYLHLNFFKKKINKMKFKRD